MAAISSGETFMNSCSNHTRVGFHFCLGDMDGVTRRGNYGFFLSSLVGRRNESVRFIVCKLSGLKELIVQELSLIEVVSD